MQAIARLPVLLMLFTGYVPVYTDKKMMGFALWLNDRIGHNKVPIVALIFLVLCAMLFGMLTLFSVDSILMTGLALFVTDAALICAFITAFALPIKYFSSAVVGSAIGLALLPGSRHLPAFSPLQE